MINERWDRYQEPNESNQNQATHKVVGLGNKVKLHLVLEKDVFDQTSLQCLESNSDDQPCGFALESIIYTHIHESKFCCFTIDIAFDRLKHFCPSIEGLVLVFDRVVTYR